MGVDDGQTIDHVLMERKHSSNANQQQAVDGSLESEGGREGCLVRIEIDRLDRREMLIMFKLTIERMSLAPILCGEQLAAKDTRKLWSEVAEMCVIVSDELGLLDEFFRAYGTRCKILFLYFGK